MMLRMIPSIYYEDLEDGCDLFANCLGFELLHRDDGFAVLQRDNAQLFLVRDTEMAERDRPHITLLTDTIESVHAQVRTSHPAYLHPDMKTVQVKEWGGREFAVRDRTDVCVFIRQFDD